MAFYRLSLKKDAEKEIRSLPKNDLKRIIQKIQSLSENPEGYRIRQGDYRIVYLVDDSEKAVRVVRVGHRREVYR